MTPEDQAKVVVFGDDALHFVEEELRTAGEDFDGPLARRLLRLEFEDPFSFLRDEPRPSARPFRDGGVADASADRELAEAISGWLRESDDHRRIVVLEELLGRRSDPAPSSHAMYCDDRIYYFADAAADAGEVARAFRRPSGYPGVGALVRASPRDARPREITLKDLDEFAEGAVAVLARAWDGEAFLVAPVVGKLTPRDLRSAADLRGRS